ncbi:MAG TPA: hypothetical protein DEA55_11630, partial [Rhodospirillaceae bacterium]|nr:hypothetical protein [Rhodospirillaceae bacterium]
ALQQKIEMDTMAANGTLINDFRSGNFSFSRLLEHAGYGAAFGGGIGGTAPVAISAIGKRLKSIFGFNASPALKEVTALHGEKVILNADGTIRSINGEAVKPGRFFLDADNEVMPNLAMAGGNDSPPVGNVPTPEGGNNTGRQGQGTTINNYSGPVTINNYNGPAPSGQATPAPHTQGAAAEQVQPASKPTESKVATEASEPVTSAQKEVPKQESTTEQVSPSDNQITVLETTKGPDGTHRHDPQTQPDDSAGQEMPLHDGDGELLRNPEEKQKQRSAAGQQTQTGPSGSDGPPGEPATPPPDAGQAPNNTGGTGPSPTGKLIPLPKRTWWHTAAYVLSIPRRLPWIGDNAADASKFLPNDLAFGKYIKGVIKGIDEKIVGNNLVESFKKLEKDMEILSLRAHDPSNGITVEVAKAESIKIIKAFVDAHHKDLKKFSADINPIIDELELEHGIAKVFEDANRNEGGYAFGKREGNGKAGQLKIDELIARYNEKWPGTLDASYAKKMESNFKNGTKGYFRLKASQAQAMLDYARDLRDVSTRLAKVQDGNPDFLELYKKDFTSILEGKTDSASVADALKKSLWEIKKLTGNTNQELSSNAEQRLKDMPRTEGMARVKALAKWLWPNWLGGGNSRSNYLENLEAQQRMFDIGYYNRHRRITPIVKGDEMDNLERIAIQIEALNSKDPKTVETKIEGFIRISYALGREWEGMKALQRLQWMIGKKPDNQVAENIKSTLTNRPRREDERTLDKFHSGEYLSLVHDKAGEAAALILHSPQTYSQRDVLRIYTEFSNIFWHGRRFAGAGEVAAPFTKYHYIMFKERLKNNFWSYISGGTTLDNPNFDPLKEPGTGNLPYHNKWNFGLRWGAKPADMSSFQHLMTNAPVWYAVPFRAVTFPLV